MLALFGAPHLTSILDGYQQARRSRPAGADGVPLHQVHPLLVTPSSSAAVTCSRRCRRQPQRWPHWTGEVTSPAAAGAFAAGPAALRIDDEAGCG